MQQFIGTQLIGFDNFTQIGGLVCLTETVSMLVLLSKLEALDLSGAVLTVLDVLTSLCVQACDTFNQPCLELIGNKLIDKPYSYSGDHYLFQLTQ